LSQRVRPQLAEALSGLDLVFIIGALGGATSSGISPMVAETSREQGLLTVAGAILPFALEGPRRRQIAEAAFKALARRSDICVAMDNQCFADFAGEETLSATLSHAPAAFLPLYQSILGALGSEPGIAHDHADLRHLISGCTGKVSMGFSSTDDQAFDELLPRALAHPLFGATTLANAKALLLCIQAPPSALQMTQVKKWVCALEAKASKAAVFWNVTANPDNGSKTALTVLARAHS
jgi:cell division protein FtsZ